MNLRKRMMEGEWWPLSMSAICKDALTIDRIRLARTVSRGRQEIAIV